jgi:hypothetical protein
MFDDTLVLTGRISALASETPVFVGKARVLSVEHGGLAAMLDEIDATVLSTRLRFDNGAAQIALDVAGRRLLRIAEVEGSVAMPEGLLGATLSTERAEELNGAVHVLDAFASGSDGLNVMTEAANGAARGDSVSVAAICAALEKSAEEPEAPATEAEVLPSAEPEASPLGSLLDACGDSIKAALRLDGNTVAQTKGSIAHVQALKSVLSGQADAFIERRAKACASHGEPSLTLLQNTLAPGLGTGLAVIGEELMLLAYDTNAVATLLKAWKTVL